MTYPQEASEVLLVFEKAASTVDPLAVNLTFGETSGPPPDAEYDTTFAVKFKLRGSVTVNYDISVWRGVSASVVAPNQQAAATSVLTAAAWKPGKSTKKALEAAFDQAQEAFRRLGAVWKATAPTHTSRQVAWNTAAALHERIESLWRYGTPAGRSMSAPWQAAQPIDRRASLRFGLGKATPRRMEMPWQQAAPANRFVEVPSNRAGKHIRIDVETPWQQARTLSSYGGRRYLPPPAAVVPPIPPVIQDLRFCALYPEGGHNPAEVMLVFGFNPCGGVTPDAPLFILPARVYMNVNSVAAFLVPSGEPIPIFDLSLAADMDSTVWTFSASTPASYFDALVPVSRVPQKLRCVINGIEWVMLVENLQERTVFGQRRASIGGRSVTALLGDPYANITEVLSTVANTAQQLALDALEFSGVTLDWSIEDWLVPAGAWSHSGTPLEALQTIAQSVGGFINSHRSLPEIIVRHPYPKLPGGIPGGPWNWEGAAGSFAADVELAPDAIRERSVERLDGPDVDGVWVSGTVAGGIERHVIRSGTLGAKLAAGSANPLVTAQSAATQLGYSILGLGGGKHRVTLTLPVRTGVDEPGVLEVGQLVQVNDPVPWRGRVRGVEVSFQPPTLTQTVTLERHLMV